MGIVRSCLYWKSGGTSMASVKPHFQYWWPSSQIPAFDRAYFAIQFEYSLPCILVWKLKHYIEERVNSKEDTLFFLLSKFFVKVVNRALTELQLFTSPFSILSFTSSAFIVVLSASLDFRSLDTAITLHWEHSKYLAYCKSSPYQHDMLKCTWLALSVSRASETFHNKKSGFVKAVNIYRGIKKITNALMIYSCNTDKLLWS